MNVHKRYNYPSETMLAVFIAILFLFSSGTRINYTPVPVTVKSLAPKKRDSEDEEEMEIERRITNKQLRVGLEYYNAKIAPVKARKASIKRMWERKLAKLRNAAQRDSISIVYAIN